MPKVKAIIFDCFGVLATDGWLPFRQKHFGNNARLLNQAIKSSRESDAGLITPEDFLQHISKLAKLPLATVRAAVEHNVPDEQLFEFISRELKPHYKLGILSNAGANWLNDIFTPVQLALFDATALSFETGAIKPQPSAYQVIADRLGVSPAEAIFIDDQPKYLEGAQAVGMQGILFLSLAQLKADLAKLLSS